MKIAICNETYKGLPFETACDHAATCGYEGVELAPFTLSNDPSLLSERDAAAIAETAARFGLSVVGMHWLLARPDGLHLTTADRNVRARTVAFVEHLARLCAAMGGRLLVWGAPAQRSLGPDVTWEEAARNATDVLRQVCETIAPLGVEVALEPLPACYTNFLTTTAETVELIERVGHPCCRLHVDVAALCSEREPIDDLIRAHGARVAHLHANDPSLRGPGSGDVDYAPILTALSDIGYDGWISVKVYDYAPNGPAVAADSISYLQRMIDQLSSGG